MSSVSKRLLSCIGVCCTMLACSAGDSPSVSKPAEDTFNHSPTAADRGTIESQLKRYKGQTSFLNPYDSVYNYRLLHKGVPDEFGSEARTIEESDIFKIGDGGLLYLLNNYRGLQVVSYEDGSENPRLIGRVDATGNFPKDMYLDEAGQRIVVLESIHYDSKGEYQNDSNQSRIIVYDVSDPRHPRISQILEVKGDLADSRLVGDVLYVATAVYPSYRDRQAGNKGEGYVYSYKIAADGLGLVESQKLALPVSSRGTMNIVEVAEDGTYEYYLIAVLSESKWSWIGGRSVVEVVDITDPAGDIEPLMMAPVKGFISERSQTYIKDDTLIAVSNYVVDGTGIARVAVESFAFPKDGDENLSKAEAEYRHLHMERQLRLKKKDLVAQGYGGIELEDRLDAYRKVLNTDSELGLKGRFVKEDGISALQKLVPDQRVTVGDSRGQSASLQDVRYSEGLLYVFWVPTDRIDPLEVFDISSPAENLTHLEHLEVEGWIEKAIPVTYDGKEYLISLGWTVETLNNDTLHRYPQAVLFEIKRGDGGLRATTVSQLNLSDARTWTNFNAADKDIDVRFEAAGKGAIMYAFSSWTRGGYVTGGKLLGFDIAKAAGDEPVFKEGGVLLAQEGWLRRVFRNPEIDRVNTFTDQALGTYDPQGSIGAADRFIEAAHVLELARNVVAYEVMRGQGVQIVSDYSWWSSGENETELRLVDRARADTEKSEALASLTIPGRYLHHVKVGDELLVMTMLTKREVDDDSTVRYVSTYHVARAAITPERLVKRHEVKWESGEQNDDSTPRLGFEQKLIALGGTRVLAAAGSEIKELALGDDLSVRSAELRACPISGTEIETAGIKVFSGDLYFTYSERVDDPKRPNVYYLRNFIGALNGPTSDDTATYSCSEAVNIPGIPIQVRRDGHIVTSDLRLIDIKKVNTGDDDHLTYKQRTSQALDSLEWSGENKAVLVDLYDPEDVEIDAIEPFGQDRFAFVESEGEGMDQWGGLEDIVPRYPYGGDDVSHALSILSFDENLEFTKESHILDLEGKGRARIIGVYPRPEGEGYLAAIKQGRQFQVAGFGNGRPELLNLRPTGPDFKLLDPTKAVVLNGYGWTWWYGTDKGINFTPAQQSFEIPVGFFGITQVYLAR